MGVFVYSHNITTVVRFFLQQICVSLNGRQNWTLR